MTGTDILYLGAPAGYAEDPADTINYVSKHDNQTLWDNHQYRLPFDMRAEDRVSLQVQSLSYPLLAQGIPFIHMGSETLRSKSFLRDSYNFGHWFNTVDFTYQTNNYNVGLPPAVKDKNNWPIISEIITSNEGRDIPSPELIKRAKDDVMDLMRVRQSSPLFRLPTADDINARIRFLNTGSDQIDGLIVMSIDDGFHNPELANLDPNSSEIIVLFNHAPQTMVFELDNMEGLGLHPQLAKFNGAIDKENALISVPNFTTLALVRMDD